MSADGRRLARALIVCTIMMIGPMSRVRAQSVQTVPTVPAPGASVLPERLSPASRALVQQLADSLWRETLPADALIDKAAEGALKGATEDRIVSAVRALAQRLRLSRTLLGAAASRDELLASSSALFAGVPSSAIARFATAQRARADAASLTVPLSIIAELASARVPFDVAMASVTTLVSRGAADADLRAFRSNVERDIRQGQSPRDAAAAGVQRTLRGIDRVP